MTNRLNLDFSLNTVQARTEWLTNYLDQITFTPTEDELITMSNYLLRGKDEQSGRSLVDDKFVSIPSKSGTWDAPQHESLEALCAQPDFLEGTLSPLGTLPPSKKQRQKFSRTEAAAIPELAQILTPIWEQIDRLDLLLCFWDIAHGKREKPPRPSLLNSFSESEVMVLRDKADHLNIYQYWKKRHLLVELRRQQYFVRDSFKPEPIRALPTINQWEIEEPDFWDDHSVAPFNFNPLIFQPFINLHPTNFTDHELNQISNILWHSEKHPHELDMRDPEVGYAICQDYFTLRETEVGKIFDYYEEQANLDPFLHDIIELKKRKRTNNDIAWWINRKYNKTYTANYISTLYKQKALVNIAAAASYHEKVIGNLFFEENFKQCSKCGRWYLIGEDNFIRKAKSADGFANRCKACDKQIRQQHKR